MAGSQEQGNRLWKPQGGQARDQKRAGTGACPYAPVIRRGNPPWLPSFLSVVALYLSSICNRPVSEDPP